MYDNLAREMEDDYFTTEGQTTISAADYVDAMPALRRKLTTDSATVTAAWEKDVVQRLKELVGLKPNWDSYGARQVNERLAQTTLQILGQLMRSATPGPSIVPTPAGHIQVEWHTRGIDLEVEVVSPILLRVEFEDQRTGEEWEQDLNVNLSRLDQAIRTLSDRQP